MTRFHILVVDNDDAVLDVVIAALESRGFEATKAASGLAAIAAYERGGIDLVLMDVRMPGMDGPQTLAAIRATDPEFRCCFMTTGASRYSVHDLMGMGATYVFSKPFGSIEYLELRLRSVIEGFA